MSFFGFMKSFGQEKIKEAGSTLTQTLASWDPETASRAEIDQMEEKLDKLTTQVAGAKQAYQKEQREADEIQALYEQRMKAAEILQQRLSEADEAKGAQIEEALITLVQELEDMQAEVEREIKEAVEAKAFMKELEEVATTAANKLSTAKRTLDQAKQEMQRAKIREERAKEKAEQSAMVAGLRSETDQLGSALSAFQKEADKANAKAEAHTMKSKLLAPSKKEASNDLIADALKEAQGEGKAKPSNIADRLAALKK